MRRTRIATRGWAGTALLIAVHAVVAVGVPSLVTTAWAGLCGSADVIPNCRILADTCASSYSSMTALSLSDPDEGGTCGYGKLRIESISSSDGRRELKCLDLSDCSGGAGICKQVRRSSPFEFTYKCVQRVLFESATIAGPRVP